ncbi:metalloprotease 1 [Colletotrichum orchidophilum]|uniref:Metalloprotease 1 n=1 Tax=Colletotrichum orchidophilum TaxID=1209926 RepID=A0A1G4B7J7_9PEZI|nr:metalloprotease 1 [Colletotrichum orchidophilum]OHE97273.1 metalloprotease 1 [Colletotrichum orchidophilum]
MLFSLLLGASVVQASLQSLTSFCGTPNPSDAQIASSHTGRDLSHGGGSLLAANISVTVYLHSIAPNETALLSVTAAAFKAAKPTTDVKTNQVFQQATLEEQFQVLHDVYSRYGITMKLGGTSRTANASWSTVTNLTDELAMKSALRQGNYQTLNLYVQSIYPTLGRCFYPEADAVPGSETFTLDGCQIDVSTVPGADSPTGNDRGYMAVHEVGHWFGLPHTFQGGCQGTDYVDDTPAQATPSWNCTVGQDTCPDLPGLDPLYNFMNYQADNCWNEFTPGQLKRMQEQWTTFRANSTV